MGEMPVKLAAESRACRFQVCRNNVCPQGENRCADAPVGV